MTFCKFSTEYTSNSFVQIENSFLSEFMPNAPENCVKVYLFGLYKCNNPLALDNNIESFSQILNLSQEDIVSCFLYWQELGLVQLLGTTPLEVRYLPVKHGSAKLKKFNKDKYKAFNMKAQELIARMITPLEYQEYYYLIESMHIELDALLMIIDYCVKQKGDTVGYSYILTVAKNWAYEGILTCEAVENRLMEQEKNSSDITLVLKELGIKRNATTDEYQMFLSWKNDLEFDLDIILFLAKRQGKNSNGFTRLNTTVMKCYNLKLNSIKEITQYFEIEKTYYDIAKNVCKNLGIYYNSLEVIVETYITPWTTLGFDADALNKIANYCFKTCIRNLEGMNNKVNQLFKLGLLTSADIDNYVAELVKSDAEIKDVLQKLGIERNVTPADRQLYKTWKYDWNLSDELIEYACQQSNDKYLPIQYLNRLLSQYHNEKIDSVEKAQKHKPREEKTISTKKPVARDYTSKELNSLFDDIMEVEI